MVKNKDKISTILLMIVIISASFIAGYYFGYEAGSLENVKILRIGHLVADLHHLPFFVAFSKGFYEGEGIAPKRLEYPNGPAQMLAFSAGDLDAGYVGIVPAIIAKAKGADLLILASSNLEGSALVSKFAIKSVYELNGKTVGTPGVGTIQDCLIRLIEIKFNIKTTHKNYKVSDLPLALANGEIDAYIAWEPVATLAVVDGIGHIILTSHDIMPSHQCCVLYVSGKLYKEKFYVVEKLVRAHVKAVKFVMDNKADAIKIFSNLTGISLNVVEEAFGRIIWDYNPNVESIKDFVAYLIQQNKINVEDVEKFVREIFPSDLQKLLKRIEEA